MAPAAGGKNDAAETAEEAGSGFAPRLARWAFKGSEILIRNGLVLFGGFGSARPAAGENDDVAEKAKGPDPA